MGGSIDASANPNKQIEILRRIYKLAKSNNAKLITISNPTKKYITPKSKFYRKSGYPSNDEISDWINDQDISDAVIDASKFNKSDFEKNMFYLDSAAQQEIAAEWITTVNSLELTATKLDQPEKSDKEADDSKSSNKGSSMGVNVTAAAMPAIATLSKNPGSVQAFVDMWSSVAKDHQRKFGIPASITLAQGGLESGWGRSYLATQGNNYFGIKCHTWSGEKIYADDDHPNECFRKYANAAESFEDHAKFLMKNSRYNSLFKLPATDYRAWAIGLKAAGYATSATYAEKLITVIEQYGLYKYDGGDAKSNKSSEKSDYNLDTDDKMKKILDLPFEYQDISSASTYRRKGEPLDQDKYFIIHHTAGRGSAKGVVNTLNTRVLKNKAGKIVCSGGCLGVQWVVDREGKIYQTLPWGSRGAHILDSALGPTNGNSQGVEVVANDDADILPIQAAAVFKLVKALGYSPGQIYGHGEVNPGHKQATEGYTIKQYILKNWNKF